MTNNRTTTTTTDLRLGVGRRAFTGRSGPGGGSGFVGSSSSSSGPPSPVAGRVGPGQTPGQRRQQGHASADAQCQQTAANRPARRQLASQPGRQASQRQQQQQHRLVKCRRHRQTVHPIVWPIVDLDLPLPCRPYNSSSLVAHLTSNLHHYLIHHLSPCNVCLCRPGARPRPHIVVVVIVSSSSPSSSPVIAYHRLPSSPIIAIIIYHRHHIINK